MALSPQWLDELRARTSLSGLIGRSVKLTRAGREYKACCPFHDEKTPSFHINDSKGFYHCFGCQAHGDAIRWLTDYRGLPFMDAVKELAAAAGMEMPAPDPRAAQAAERAHSLRDVTEAAANWYRELLNAPEGAEARAYLERRGIRFESIARFGLGFAPDAKERMREVLSRFGDAMAVEAGMLIAPEAETGEKAREPYDRFRGRLMIPIRDVRGRVIAFGGRLLGPGEPKYLNSPDTPIFDKGRQLYNLDRASEAARKAGRLIIVEGYMDVIALDQVGIGEVVAPLGTALTEHQIELAWKHSPVPILAFDGDRAGRKAAMRAAERVLPMLRPGHSLAFAALPPGCDPDDLVREQGREGFDEVLASAVPLVELLWQHAFARPGPDTPERRAAVRSSLMDQVATIGDRDVAAHYREAFRARIDEAFFARRTPFEKPTSRGVAGWKQRFAPLSPPDPRLSGIGDDVAAGFDDAILLGLLRHPAAIGRHIDMLAVWKPHDPKRGQLLRALVDAAMDARTGLDQQGLLTILARQPVYPVAEQLLGAGTMRFSFTHDGDGGVDEERAVRDLGEAIAAVSAWPEVRAALAAATSRASETLDETSFEEQQRLLRVKAELESRLSSLAEAAA